MKDLRAANQLMRQIAKDYPAITPVEPSDFDLFAKFFDREPHTYGNSWTYITQNMYGMGPTKIGYKYYDGKNLSAVSAYPKVEEPGRLVFYWVRPMGDTVTDAINDLSKTFMNTLRLPTYAKKLFKGQYDRLLSNGFKDITAFPWHTVYPAEDDTFPEQILDIGVTLNAAQETAKNRRLRRSFEYYELYKRQKDCSSGSVYSHEKDALGIIEQFFIYKNAHSTQPVISEPSDYHAMVQGLSKSGRTVEKYYTYKDSPIGFSFSETQSNGYASQYALLSLRQKSNHIVDYLMFDLLYSLKSRGVTYVNLGGSENEELDFFKKKYLPAKENKMFWVTRF